ncbi:hypothetical protein IX51_07825 [uncultured archaeon]|nr:hypothetical protein IX51_07825 [uncultured archaeon]HKJ97182.1 hypothetical protein [Thermoplasmataceae archaeon]
MSEREEERTRITGEQKSKGPGITSRSQMRLVIASILSVIAWAVFILVFALAWSGRFSIFQNIIVTIVSLFITGLVIGLVWVIWGSKESWNVR